MVKQAVEFYNQAIGKDPNYALAYSGLAESYVLFPNYSAAVPQESMPRAKAAAVQSEVARDVSNKLKSKLAITWIFGTLACEIGRADEAMKLLDQLK